MNNDLISRSELKKAINAWDKFACLPNGKLEPFRNLEHPEIYEAYIHFRDIIKAIDNTPTVDTDLSKYSDKLWKTAYERGKNERPQGEWMKIEAPSYTIIRCTCCGYKDNAIYIPNYCPNCGADMKEAEK